ncbi:MAG: DegT/DnrJ/EryC1/StrS family aminotransferase, partial [bacterium]
ILASPSDRTIEDFERVIADRFSVPYGIAYASARSATKALLNALNYPQGAKILLPSLNYPAIPMTIHALGFRIQWVPNNEKNLSPGLGASAGDDLKDAVALICPHYFGFPAPIDAIRQFCDRNGLDLIEDCAHAMGACYNGKPVGSFGKAAFVSFETSKMLNTFGGGMILTSDQSLSEKLLRIRTALPQRSSRSILRGIVKSYTEWIITNRWVFSMTVYPLLHKAKITGKEDFLEEGLHCPAPREIAGYSPLQAAAGLRQNNYFTRNLAELRRQWSAIQSVIDDAGMGFSIDPKAEPNGYMTAGMHHDVGAISAAFYRRGIDVKRHYMHDCQKLGIGAGGERCAELAEKIFHIPTRTDLSEQSFSSYLSVIKDVLRNFQTR